MEYDMNPMDLVRHWLSQNEYQRAYDEAIVAKKSSHPPSDMEMRKLASTFKESGQLDLAVSTLLAIDDPGSVLNMAKGFNFAEDHSKAVKLFLKIGAYTEAIDTLKTASHEVVKEGVSELKNLKALESLRTLKRELAPRSAENEIANVILDIDSVIPADKAKEAVPVHVQVPAQAKKPAAEPAKAAPAITVAPPKVELPPTDEIPPFQAIAARAADRISDSCAKNKAITITKVEFIAVCKALTCHNEEKLKSKVSSALLGMLQKDAPRTNLTGLQFDVLYNTLEQFLVYMRQLQEAVAPRKAAIEAAKARSEEEIVTEHIKVIIARALESAARYARSADELPSLRKKLDVLLAQDSGAMPLKKNLVRLEAIDAAKIQISDREAILYRPFEMNDAVFNTVCKALDPGFGRKDLRDAVLASLPSLGAALKCDQGRINALSSAAYKAIEFDAVLETGSIADVKLRISVLESLPMFASSFSLDVPELGYLHAKGTDSFVEMEQQLSEKNTRTIVGGLGELNNALTVLQKELELKIPDPEGFSYTISMLLEMISARKAEPIGSISAMGEALGLDRKAFHKPGAQGTGAAHVPPGEKGKNRVS